MSAASTRAGSSPASAWPRRRRWPTWRWRAHGRIAAIGWLHCCGATNDNRASHRSLTSALANLLQLLGPLGDSATLKASRSDVWLQISPDLVAVDVNRLQELLDWTAGHAHRSPIFCDPCSERLAQAADIYTGSFLPGMAFADCPAFDERQRAQQERLYQRILEGLDVLATHHLAAGRFGLAENYARRQLSLQPWCETAHRQLMLALARAGQRSAALAQYDLCRTSLAAELGVRRLPSQMVQLGQHKTVDAVEGHVSRYWYHGAGETLARCSLGRPRKPPTGAQAAGRPYGFRPA